MISHEHKCIFIHIPKTAGSSVEQKLGLYKELHWGAQDHTTIRDIQPITLFTAVRLLTNPQHALSRKAVLRAIVKASESGRLSRIKYKRYLKFTVVRNPWDRVHSWYRNAMRDQRHGLSGNSFSEFIRMNMDNWALQPQLHWITDLNGQMAMDYIIKFENLAIEMPLLLERLGFSDPSLPHLLNSKKDDLITVDYRDAYDQRSIEIVGERYDREIKLFDYQFHPVNQDQ